MSGKLVLAEKHGAMTVLSLNRPERRNALSTPLMKELCEAISCAEKDASQRVIVIKGEGPAFCAGLDLEEAADLKRAEAAAKMVARTLLAVHGSPLVTIAAVHGSAMAGGAGLMSACDLAIAAEDAQIGYPETRRGLVAAVIIAFLRRQLGERHIRELLLTGEPIPVRRAWQIGLVNHVVPAEDLMKEVGKIAEAVAQGGPQATALTKKILDETGVPVARAMVRALRDHMKARRSKEAQEGIRAFLEKRLPKW